MLPLMLDIAYPFPVLDFAEGGFAPTVVPLVVGLVVVAAVVFFVVRAIIKKNK